MKNAKEPGMTFETIRGGECLTVRICGHLDARTAPALSDGMSKVLDGVTKIVFDLSKLNYISSAGMRILLASFKLMAKREGTMRVENVQPDVMNVLDMSGFAVLFNIGE